MSPPAWTTLVALVSLPVFAQGADARQLATMPEPAVATLREEMRSNLAVLSQLMTLVVSGKVTGAGALAEQELGKGAMGQHRDRPVNARPGPHMPAAMHELARNQHLRGQRLRGRRRYRRSGEGARRAAIADRQLRRLPLGLPSAVKAAACAAPTARRSRR